MVDPKRLKSTRNRGKKKGAAKQASKKKQLSCKSKNDDLREVLDRQAQSLYPVYGVVESTPQVDFMPAHDISQTLTDVLENFGRL